MLKLRLVRRASATAARPRIARRAHGRAGLAQPVVVRTEPAQPVASAVLARAAIVGCMLGLVVASPVAAQPSPGPAVAVAVYGWPKSQARRIRQRVREAAQRAQIAGVVEPWIEEAAFDGRAPPDLKGELAAVRTLLDQAEQQLAQFQIAEAKGNVQEALRHMSGNLGRTVARPYDYRRLQLAVKIAHAERDENAVSALLEEFALRYWSIAARDTQWPPDIMAQLQALQQRLPKRRLFINSPRPAQVAVDGLAIGPTPAAVDVPIGRHRVEVVADGAWPGLTWASVGDEGAAVVVSPQSPLVKKLSTAQTLSPALEARIRQTGRRWRFTDVYTVGPAPNDKIKLDRLGERRAGPIVVDRSVEAVRLGIIQLWSPPEEEEPQLWPWVTVGAGAAAIGTGVALRVVAQSTQDDFQSQRHFLTQAQAFELRDQGDREATSGTVLIGVGAAALAGGLTWAILEWMDDDE